MVVYDQLNRKVEIPFPPQRIISVVPSQTELLFYMGLTDQVVGITKFCVHPKEWFKGKTIVGGTKKFRFDIIDQLQPDLIIGNKEENYLDGISKLKEKYPVWMSDISSYEDAINMITSLGKIVEREPEAINLITAIEKNFSQLISRKLIRVVYLIWRAPWMAAGNDSFIHSMLSKMSLVNGVEELRYPTLSDSQLIELDPELIMLSSEPYPFSTIHIEQLNRLLPKAKIILVDGEMFSWYGSRMLLAPQYFNSLHW